MTEKSRLDHVLAVLIPGYSRSRIAKEISAGTVGVDGEPVLKPGAIVRPGQVIEVGSIRDSAPHDLTPVDIPLVVPYEDEHMLVVDKPRGIAVHPAPSVKAATLVQALLARPHSLSSVGPAYRPGIVHRLDKETTGLMLVAKTDQAHRSLAAQIAERSVGRVYVAWIHGEPPHSRFTIDSPIARHGGTKTKMSISAGGKHAVTHVKLLETRPGMSLVACRLETGRTHQIRVHLAHFQLPVVGDRTYGTQSGHALQLHSCWIGFSHPVSGEEVEVFSVPPMDFIGNELVREEAVKRWT